MNSAQTAEMTIQTIAMPARMVIIVSAPASQRGSEACQEPEQSP